MPEMMQTIPHVAYQVENMMAYLKEPNVLTIGGTARYVTALPKHFLAEATMNSVRAVGIDTQYVLRTDKGRLGLYFLETGANQRPSNVIYDRANSAVAITPADQYDWDAIFDGAQWLHLSGVTPALSKNAAEATLVAAQKAKAAGTLVSIDLNFRENSGSGMPPRPRVSWLRKRCEPFCHTSMW